MTDLMRGRARAWTWDYLPYAPACNDSVENDPYKGAVRRRSLGGTSGCDFEYQVIKDTRVLRRSRRLNRPEEGSGGKPHEAKPESSSPVAEI